MLLQLFSVPENIEQRTSSYDFIIGHSLLGVGYSQKSLHWLFLVGCWIFSETLFSG
jgi:hypothetical protein